MPLYEYLCGSCGHRFERIQKFSDAPVTECPSCGGAVEKQPSSPAIQFKGSGWYITDYAKSGSNKDPGKSSTGEKSSSGASSSASDSTSSSSSSSESTSTAAPATPAKTDTK